jgi:hypothetical protein
MLMLCRSFVSNTPLKRPGASHLVYFNPSDRNTQIEAHRHLQCGSHYNYSIYSETFSLSTVVAVPFSQALSMARFLIRQCVVGYKHLARCLPGIRMMRLQGENGNHSACEGWRSSKIDAFIFLIRYVRAELNNWNQPIHGVE